MYTGVAGRRRAEFFQRERVRVSGGRVSQRDQHENEAAGIRHGAVRLHPEHVSLRQPLHQALQHARYVLYNTHITLMHGSSLVRQIFQSVEGCGCLAEGRGKLTF